MLDLERMQQDVVDAHVAVSLQRPDLDSRPVEMPRRASTERAIRLVGLRRPVANSPFPPEEERIEASLFQVDQCPCRDLLQSCRGSVCCCTAGRSW